MHVALIDDDPAVLDSLALYLKRQTIAGTCFVSADAFIAKFTEKVKGLKVGNGFEAGVTIGPVIEDKAITKIEG